MWPLSELSPPDHPELSVPIDKLKFGVEGVRHDVSVVAIAPLLEPTLSSSFRAYAVLRNSPTTKLPTKAGVVTWPTPLTACEIDHRPVPDVESE